MLNNQIVCAWCQTLNSAAEAACIACGAPIEKLQPVLPSSPPAPPVPPVDVLAPKIQELKQAGENLDEAYSGALKAYSLLWRTLGEIFAIALTAFLLGLLGGMAHLAPLGVVGGAVVGLVVGRVVKSFWWHLLTPLGLLIGAIIGLLPWALGAGPAGMFFSALLFALLAVWLGRSSVVATGWWQRLRPWLGTAGGLLFGMLGALLGLSLEWLVRQIGAWF